jgi:dethiobiotin synthase
MSRDLFVTGTDTNVGKTVLSALLVAALDGIYWKPIQTGRADGTDRQAVMHWAEVPEDRTISENYCFDPPVSPHLAAERAGVSIDLSSIRKPALNGGAPLIVEGAGGVLVPVNDSATMLDLMRQLGMPVIIASRSALGTINHTTLTVHELRNAGVAVKGVVAIGPENRDNEKAIERYARTPVIGRIPVLGAICREALLQVFRTNFDRDSFV